MKAVDEAFKSGVNFFDVAPFYASGDAERVRIAPASRLCQKYKIVKAQSVPDKHVVACNTVALILDAFLLSAVTG